MRPLGVGWGDVPWTDPCRQAVTRPLELDFRRADSQDATAEPLFVQRWRSLTMQTIRAYSLQSDAEIARIALEGAEIPAVVVGVGIGMKGGVLLVPEDRIEAALKVLKDLEELR